MISDENRGGPSLAWCARVLYASTQAQHQLSTLFLVIPPLSHPREILLYVSIDVLTFDHLGEMESWRTMDWHSLGSAFWRYRLDWGL